MNYVVAVSGGVDSVVLLDMIVHRKLSITSNDNLRGLTFQEKTKDLIPSTTHHPPPTNFIVAHFDHGIRPDSAADARFVRALAASYGFAFESKREELGAQASEALARERRYAFLREVAARYDAEIVTAHHLDDLVETIAINLIRGTGWRGLAVLGDPTIHRPLLGFTKMDLYTYAAKQNLEWVEDETNQQNDYLRNRLRRRIQPEISLTLKQELAERRDRQLQLTKEIDEEARPLLKDNELAASRYFFTMIDETSALELLRGLTGGHLTRPQLLALWYGIKTARPSSRQQIGGGLHVHFVRREFIVKSDD